MSQQSRSNGRAFSGFAVIALIVAGCTGGHPGATSANNMFVNSTMPAMAGSLDLTRKWSTGRMSVSLKGLRQGLMRTQATLNDISYVTLTLSGPNLPTPMTKTVLSADLVLPTLTAVTFDNVPEGPVTLVVTAYDTTGKPIGSQTISAAVTAGADTPVPVAVQLDATPAPGTPSPSPVGSLTATVTFSEQTPVPSPTPTPTPQVFVAAAQEEPVDGGTPFSTTARVGESFMLYGDITLTKLDLMLKAEGGLDANVTVSLYATDKTGSPTGSPICQASVTVANPAFAWTPVTFATPVAVVGNTTYAWVLDCASGAASAAFSNGDVYGDGANLTFDAAVSPTWTSVMAPDFSFRLYSSTRPAAY
ncbi:MAG: hypothetical protein H7338_00575 [Candidatus Sericytochromatia bacterium]|nr:hypothetical protein [Candidatus Sericytochromatia bacterium]